MNRRFIDKIEAALRYAGVVGRLRVGAVDLKVR